MKISTHIIVGADLLCDIHKIIRWECIRECRRET